MTLGIERLKAELRAKLGGRQDISLQDRRAAVDAIADFGAPGCEFPFQDMEIAGIPTTRFGERDAIEDAIEDGAIIHLHGGAFVAGSAQSHKYLAGTLAAQSGFPVYVPDYRLAPEHPYPEAIEDTVAVTREIVSRVGDSRRVALSGDSAGGALMLAAACRLRDEDGLALGALAALSPFVDMRCENSTFRTLASVDPFINQQGLCKDAAAYLHGADPADPGVSPVFADLSGLPSLLIQIGSSEVLMGDAKALQAAAEAAGVRVRLDVWSEMIHVWHLFPRFVSEADDAVRDIANFFKAELGP